MQTVELERASSPECALFEHFAFFLSRKLYCERKNLLFSDYRNQPKTIIEFHSIVGELLSNKKGKLQPSTVKAYFVEADDVARIEADRLRNFCDSFDKIFARISLSDQPHYLPTKHAFDNWRKTIYKNFGWAIGDSSEIAQIDFDKSKMSSELATQKGLARFLEQPVFYYHSTAENAEVFWCCSKLDFTSGNKTGNDELIATVSLSGISGLKKNEYTAKLGRKSPSELLIIYIGNEKDKESDSINIFDKVTSLSKFVGGLMYHDDWDEEMRVSPCLLSFLPLFELTKTGPITSVNDNTKLQQFWDDNFVFKNLEKSEQKKLFEPYKVLSKISVKTQKLKKKPSRK